jgi:hypothetical protein
MPYKFFVFTGKCKIFIAKPNEDYVEVGISPREGVSLIFDVEEEVLSASDRIYDIDSIIHRRTFEIEMRIQHITDDFFRILLGGAYDSNASPEIPNYETGQPDAVNHQITLQTAGTVIANSVNAYYLKTGAPLEKVSANPSQGEFTYDNASKTLTFSSGGEDDGKDILITYLEQGTAGTDGNVFYISEDFTPEPLGVKIWANVIRKSDTAEHKKITLEVPRAKIISAPTIDLSGTPPTYSVRFRAHPYADGSRIAKIHYTWV